MKKYMQLIKFTIFHDYYNNGKFCDSDLLIYEGKKEADKNYKLILCKKEPGVFVLYIDGTDNLKERLQFLIDDLENPHTLSFLLVSLNNSLESFTKDIDIKSNNQLLILRHSIQDGNALSSYKLNELEKTSGNTTFEKQIIKRTPNALIYITLKPENVILNNLLNRIKNDDPLSINIRFEVKSPVWKYLFLSGTRFSPDLSVIDPKQEINFSSVRWMNNGNDKPVGVACSEKEIPFAESYPFHFQLWKNYFNGRSLVIDRLPFPDPANTGNLSLENGDNYVSIFQYF